MPLATAPLPSPKDKGRYINHLAPSRAIERGIRYTVTSVAALDEMGFMEWSILNILTSKPANFQWKMATLHRETRLGVRKLRGLIATLRKHGYLRITPIYRDGRFAGQLWEATQTANSWASQPAENEASLSPIQNRPVCGGERNILPECITTPLPSPSPERAEKSISPGTGPKKVAVGSPVMEEDQVLMPVGAWGTDPAGGLEWVKESYYAEKFRQLLGTHCQWDRSSARIFYRKLKLGTIVPADIYTVKAMGLGAIRKAFPAAVSSLKQLARNWTKVINALGNDEEEGFSMWQDTRHKLGEKLRYYGNMAPQEASRFCALAREGAELPDVEPGEWNACIDDLIALRHYGYAEWITTQLERGPQAEIMEAFSAVVPYDYDNVAMLFCCMTGAQRDALRPVVVARLADNYAFADVAAPDTKFHLADLLNEVLAEY